MAPFSRLSWRFGLRSSRLRFSSLGKLAFARKRSCRGRVGEERYFKHHQRQQLHQHLHLQKQHFCASDSVSVSVSVKLQV